MERLARLENPGIPMKQKRVKEHVGFLRMWEGQLVTRIGNAKEDFEVPESSPKRLTIDLVTVDEDGKEKKKNVNYLDFLTHAAKVRIKFLKIDRQERVEVDPEKGGGGYGNRRGRTAEGWETGGIGELGGVGLTGEEVALEVGFIDVSAEVEVLEGDFKGKTFSFTKETLNAINA